jgi:hypothetical protein
MLHIGKRKCVIPPICLVCVCVCVCMHVHFVKMIRDLCRSGEAVGNFKEHISGQMYKK